MLQVLDPDDIVTAEAEDIEKGLERPPPETSLGGLGIIGLIGGSLSSIVYCDIVVYYDLVYYDLV